MHISAGEMKLIAATVRTLVMDAIEEAKSGHPGMPMGCAEIATVLWTKILRYNPEKPDWINRDRFVLSAGHGSMLLYSMLHLSGYNISLDDLKKFRQLGSKTPGHPEYGHTPGVETTTGPLGQGIGNAVGMAIAESLLAEEFNKDNFIIDHFVYALAGDGDLMEGVSHEAASIAGHLGLGRLIVIYDSNDITIEGSTDIAFSEDVEKRFLSLNWHVQKINGHDFYAIEHAILMAKDELIRPSLIIARTKIAKGSPNKEGSEESHGAPLGCEEVKITKRNIGCDEESRFCVQPGIYQIFEERRNELKIEYQRWIERFDKTINSGLKKTWEQYFTMPDIESLRKKLPLFEASKKIATRSASGKILEALFKELPNIIGGSADLGPSNKSFVKGFSETGKLKIGRNIHFGIREHAMGAIQNGIAYYGGFIPYTSTFFVFMDYMRPPVRLAALSGLQAIYVFTHDSIFVGEDGPTHQPVEHLAAARAIVNLTVIRPADADETREAWLAALENKKSPTALILTRQDLPIIKREKNTAEELHKGAYIIWQADGPTDIIILATGSEVNIAIEAVVKLSSGGIKSRVISFPSWELFEKQPLEYRKSLLPPEIKKRVVVEAGLSMGWEKYAGCEALFITIETFGASAPAGALAEKFGMTTDNIVQRVKEYMRS
jgi:transketolase